MFALLSKSRKVLGLFETKAEIESAVIVLHKFFDKEYIIREVTDLQHLKKIMEKITEFCTESHNL